MRAELKVVEGSLAEKNIKLKEGKFIVGRAPDCHLRPDSDLVSRYHCVVRVDEYTVRVRDMGSRNGTHVNGRLIQADTRLMNGDKVKIGDMILQVSIAEAADPPSSFEIPKAPTEPSDSETSYGIPKMPK
ncbi:FHA domain-containing protein [Thalassoroseus pseudoceratinae]|uniref:FHA domain-containing protein n=1 Tax=Thalassoroseus pseudoceratinae TaxID=2713176 RepID=UPI00141F0CEE|nr:FHA domain-containing protein [Thalassoroseus pseudoceratinae]